MGVVDLAPVRRFVRSERTIEPYCTPSHVNVLRQMAARLRQAGLELSDDLVREVAANPERTAALMKRDLRDQDTALGHIARLAEAKTLRDGSSSAPMARDLFELAGRTRRPSAGRCYARTLHAIYSLHDTGEFARLLVDLAVQGETSLADGSVLRWDPHRVPVATGHVDVLWAGISHAARLQFLPTNGLIGTDAPLARDGQMANVRSRLSGIPHVNVRGREALPYLQDMVARRGPLLAEFGTNHGGSVARVENGQRVLSLEAGEHGLQARDDLGYVVVPLEEAKAHGLKLLQYPGRLTGYIGTLSPEEARRLSRQSPVAINAQIVREPSPQRAPLTFQFRNGYRLYRSFRSSGFDPSRRFPFHDAELVASLSDVPLSSLAYHARRGDFSAFVQEAYGWRLMARRIRTIEEDAPRLGTWLGARNWKRVRQRLINVLSSWVDPIRERMELPGSSTILFSHPDGRLYGGGEATPGDVVDSIPNLPQDVLEHHVRRADFSRWAEHQFARPTLAARIRTIETDTDWATVRERLVRAFYDDYAGPPYLSG